MFRIPNVVSSVGTMPGTAVWNEQWNRNSVKPVVVISPSEAMTIEPHDDDVISMEPASSLIQTNTFKASQLIESLKAYLGAGSVSSAWLGEGVNCEFLQSTVGGGWQKGKIRLRLEFVPDEEPDRYP